MGAAICRAGDGIRTREYQLGRLMPYHLATPACVLLPSEAILPSFMANENRLVGVQPHAVDIAGFEPQAGFIERTGREARLLQALEEIPPVAAHVIQLAK